MTRTHSRRALLIGGGAYASIAVVRAPAPAAQFQYRYGHDRSPDDPVHVRAVQMAADIKRETNGRLEITVFPNNILGSDPAMIEQVREGALQFSYQSGSLLSVIAPSAGIQSIPYAFRTDEAGEIAYRGELGAAIRKEIALKSGFHVFPIVLAGGFREVTSSTHPIRTPDDFVGFKIRTPPANIFVDVYKTLGAQVSTLSVEQVYTALQTRLVDGQENPYLIIETSRFYEVQKYLSVMDAIWGAAMFYCNGDAWKALPADIQAIVERNVALYAQRQGRDNTLVNNSTADKLRRQGLIVNVAERDSFKARLAPLYAKYKPLYGPTLWSLLEKYGGQLG